MFTFVSLFTLFLLDNGIQRFLNRQNCTLHRSLINLTPGDGFPSQPSSEVMGIQSVTNGGASTELALLGVQVVLHSPCQTPHCSPKVAMET